MAKKLRQILLSLRKSPLLPALLSAFMAPGAGQIMVGHVRKGLVLMAIFLFTLVWFSNAVTSQLSSVLPGKPEEWHKNPEALRAAVSLFLKNHMDLFLTFQILILLTWIYGVVDAFLTARQSAKTSFDAE